MLSTFKNRFITIMVLGILLYLPLMNTFNAWFDERFSLYITSLNWSDMFRIMIREDGHPPLHYILLKLWMTGVDYHMVGWARLFSLVSIVMTALLGIGPVRRLGGEKVALWFTALVFVYPTFLFLGTDMRMYGLLNFEITALTVYTLLILKEGKSRDWYAFWLFGILALYTHYYAVLVLAVLSAFLFFSFLCRKQNLKRNLCFLFGCAGIMGFAFLPWFIFVFLGQASYMYQNWYPDFHILTQTFALWIIPYAMESDLLTKIASTYFLVLSWLLMLQYPFNPQKWERRSSTALPIILYLSVLLLGVIISVLFRPMLSWRYMTPLAGSLMLSLAIILSEEKRFKTIFVILCGISFIGLYINRFSIMHDSMYRKFQTSVRQVFSPTDTVFLCNNIHPAMLIYFYLPEYRWQRTPQKEELAIPQTLMYRQDLTEKDLDSTQNILFLQEGKGLCQNPFLDRYDHFVEYCLTRLSPEEAKKILANSKKIMYKELH